MDALMSLLHCSAILLQSNTAMLVHYQVNSGASLARHQLTTKQHWRKLQLDKDRDNKEIAVSCGINTRFRKISARPVTEWQSALRNISENLEESIANERRNASNCFSLLVALVEGRTCVNIALEIPVPNDVRPDREGRGFLVSFAQVREMVEPLAHRVRLHIGISNTANKGWFR